MTIGERDWETDFFVGMPPRLNSLIDQENRISNDKSLTNEQEEALLKQLRIDRQNIIDRDHYSGVIEILKILNT